MSSQRQSRRQSRAEVRRRPVRSSEHQHARPRTFGLRPPSKSSATTRSTFQPVLIPQTPQNASVILPYVSFNCPIDNSTGTPVQTVHPDGKNGHLLLSNVYPPIYSQNYWQPRIGITYTVNPDTVLRALGRRLRAGAAELRNSVQQRRAESRASSCSASCPTASRRRSTTRKRSSPTTTTSRTSAISRAPTCR